VLLSRRIVESTARVSRCLEVETASAPSEVPGGDTNAVRAHSSTCPRFFNPVVPWFRLANRAFSLRDRSMTRFRLPQVCASCGSTYSSRDCPCTPVAADRAYYGSVTWRRLSRAYLRLRPYCEADQHEASCNGRSSTVDHIRPRSAGGADTFANFQALSGPCHGAKTAADRRERDAQAAASTPAAIPEGRTEHRGGHGRSFYSRAAQRSHGTVKAGMDSVVVLAYRPSDAPSSRRGNPGDAAEDEG
jgi:5-methylcytosine-specific restriction endonuclease McrA